MSSSKNLSWRGSEKNPNTRCCINLKEMKADPNHITPPPLVITIENKRKKSLSSVCDRFDQPSFFVLENL